MKSINNKGSSTEPCGIPANALIEAIWFRVILQINIRSVPTYVNTPFIYIARDTQNLENKI